jgi:hypothetical protein
MRSTARAAILAAIWVLAGACAALGAQSVTVAEAALPQSDYSVRHVCSAPAPGRAACLALRLEPKTGAARTRVLRPLATENRPPTGLPIENRPPPTNPPTDSGPPTGLTKVSECAEAYAATCVTPTGLQAAYFPGEVPEAPPSEPQTVALVDAYNDPNAQADLETYESEFSLSKCPASTSACFEKVNQRGETGNLPFPTSEAARKAELSICENKHLATTTREAACFNVEEAEGWAVEISTDIEVTRAVCQNCRILLVEANSANYPDLEVAEDTAAARAGEISNSWGSEEPASDSAAFNHPGLVVTASSGDNGYLNWTEAKEAEEAALRGEQTGYFVGADYPASSPHVVAVGGTHLNLSGNVWQGESVWNDDRGTPTENYGAGGSGCSLRFQAKPWQRELPNWSAVGCESRRAVADVSADADPYTGVAAYDSVPDFHAGEKEGEVLNTPPYWSPIGGTSVASPIIAAMYALAGGAHGVPYPAQTLYSHRGSPALHDVVSGGNGECDEDYSAGCSGSLASPFDCGAGAWICNAVAGYDGPTGVGTPNGLSAFKVIEGEQQGKTPGVESKEEVGSSAPPGSGGAAGGGAAGSGSTLGGTSNAPAQKPSVPSTASLAAPRISALALTAYARAALRHSKLAVSRLAFTCRLSRAASVRVTLAVEVHSGAHARWRSLARSFTFSARAGKNSRRLRGSYPLASGLYRLTLTAVGGATRSITLRVL